MRVLIAITYYRPHVSGLTIYVERLARALVDRGHAVTVLTSGYDPRLPREETVEGVRIVRVPVAFRVSKGVIMPTIGFRATQLVQEHDVISLHLPQFEAAGIALRGRLFRKPTLLTFHCDVLLPPGPFNRVVDQTVFASNVAAGLLADRIVAYTRDYADHSRLLRRFRRKIAVIPPPVVMPSPSPEAVAAFRQAHDLAGRPVIGYAARFAAEKGIEYLVDAMPALLASFPTLKVLFAGPYRDVIGEEEYRKRLQPRIDALGDHWQFLGTLSPADLPPFYGALDCLLVTSVNSTESFGLVQVEAMLCGTPVVVGDLPGVRQPVRTTGMGVVVPVADAPALAEGITTVLNDKARYVRPRAEVERAYDLDVTVSAYERLFAELGEMTADLATPRPDYLSRHLLEMAPHRALLRSIEAKLMAAVPLVRPVLDVGCGDGHFASVAYDEPIDVGLDLLARDLAEAAMRRPTVFLDVVRASATAMPFADGAFATVVSNCVIEHIADVEPALAEIARVLRPGGTFATTLPSEHYPDLLLGATLARRAGLARASAAYGAFFNRIAHHEHVDPPAVWRERMAAAGLEMVEHVYYFSPEATRAFDLAHYIGVPNLISKRLLGRWVFHPLQARPLERWYRRYYEEPLPAIGSCQFVRCIRR